MFDDPSWWKGWPRAPWATWIDMRRSEFLRWWRMPEGVALQQGCAERYAVDLRSRKYGGADAQTSWDGFLIGHLRNDEMPKFTGEVWSPVAYALSTWLRWWYSEPPNLGYLLKVAYNNLLDGHKQECGDVVFELLGEDFERLLESYDPARAAFHTLLTVALQFKARGWRRRAGNRLPAMLTQTGDEKDLESEPRAPGPARLDTDDNALLKTLLATLSEGDAAILYLAQLKGLNGPEIATQLGIKPGAARKRLHDARRRALRAILADHGVDVRTAAIKLVLDPEPELEMAEYAGVRVLIDELPPEMSQILLLRFLPPSASPRPSADDVARQLGLKDAPYRKLLCQARHALLRKVIGENPPPLLLALLEEGE